MLNGALCFKNEAQKPKVRFMCTSAARSHALLLGLSCIALKTASAHRLRSGRVLAPAQDLHRPQRLMRVTGQLPVGARADRIAAQRKALGRLWCAVTGLQVASAPGDA